MSHLSADDVIRLVVEALDVPECNTPADQPARRRVMELRARWLLAALRPLSVEAMVVPAGSRSE